MRPAVFLDRDDTLIRCRDLAPGGDLGDPALVELLPGVAEGCRALKEAGYALVVMTNQGGVARGKYGLDAVDRVHARLNELLNGAIDAFRACPYHPNGTIPEYTREHPWRKPAPGMILDAALALGIDLSRSWVIGDTLRDCQAGRAAGCRTIMLAATEEKDPAADYSVKSFREGVGLAVAALPSSGRAHELPRRLLVIAPSWVGDVVMATPTFRAIRDRLPGSFIGVLVKPGMEGLLAGTTFFDEFHVDSREGMMGVKRASAKVRAGRYDAAILMTNSFSTAVLARIAGVPRRIGYGRDARSMLLTESLLAPRRALTAPFYESTVSARTWAPIPACEYYLALAHRLFADPSIPLGAMELAVTAQEASAGRSALEQAGLRTEQEFAVLNPGGNNPAKRWPAERFAALARWLRDDQRLEVVVAGSPGERALSEQVATLARLPVSRALPTVGLTLGSLKAVLQRAAILVTNDTGPRHIAAALGTPVVTLFGPTDPRWTTIPFDREIIVSADPTLPPCEVAEDHPERCSVDRIEVVRVQEAVRRLRS